MSWMPKAPPVTSNLCHYRMLAPNAAVRVSPLCLGAMNFGDAWKDFMGECDQKTTERILDYFYEQGGNFIDTANNYQAEESEKWIGEWMAKRGNRDQMVIATKYTTRYTTDHGEKELHINTTGNGSKSLHLSVAASLKKLQTDYIDLLYVHWWDFTTSIPELMQSLNHLVTSGKVIYLGISDTPAWIVSKANEYARNHGMRQFSVYQGKWNASLRDFERDIIPMAAAEGMALAPWGSLGGGSFKSAAKRADSDHPGRKMGGPTEAEIAISDALEKIAKEKGTEITSIALAYVMAKAPYVFPIVGGRNIEHLKGNIAALSVKLSEDDIKTIEGATPFDVGFPMNFLGGTGNPGDVFLTAMAGSTDHVKKLAAIVPRAAEQDKK